MSSSKEDSLRYNGWTYDERYGLQFSIEKLKKNHQWYPEHSIDGSDVIERLNFMREFVLAIATEDLDSNDYGMFCHWCHKETEDSPEWVAAKANNEPILERYRREWEASGEVRNPKNFRNNPLVLAVADPDWKIPPPEVPLYVVNHEPDCLHLKAKRFIDNELGAWYEI